MREVVLEISRARAASLSSRQTASSLAESQTAHDLPHAAIGVAPSMGVPPGESPGPLGHLDDEESDSEGELATAIQASLEEVEGRGSEPSASGTSEPAIPRGSLFSAHLESAHDHRMQGATLPQLDHDGDEDEDEGDEQEDLDGAVEEQEGSQFDLAAAAMGIEGMEMEMGMGARMGMGMGAARGGAGAGAGQESSASSEAHDAGNDSSSPSASSAMRRASHGPSDVSAASTLSRASSGHDDVEASREERDLNHLRRFATNQQALLPSQPDPAHMALGLSIERAHELYDTCQAIASASSAPEDGSHWRPLVQAISKVFRDPDAVCASFLLHRDAVVVEDEPKHEGAIAKRMLVLSKRADAAATLLKVERASSSISRKLASGPQKPGQAAKSASAGDDSHDAMITPSTAMEGGPGAAAYEQLRPPGPVAGLQDTTDGDPKAAAGASSTDALAQASSDSLMARDAKPVPEAASVAIARAASGAGSPSEKSAGVKGLGPVSVSRLDSEWADASALRSGIDIEGLIGFYEKLDRCPSPAALKSLGYAIEEMVGTLERRCKLLPLGKAGAHSIRPLLVLLLCPLLLDPERADAVNIPLYALMLQTDEAKDTLSLWASRLPHAAMRHCVGVVQQSLTVPLLAGQSLTVHDVDNPVQVLNLLNLGNVLHADRFGEMVVPAAEFYNEAVSTQVSLHDDYQRWRMLRRGQSTFAFLTFPFIFDAAAKFELLKEDARRQMIRHAQRSMQFQANPYLALEIQRARLLEDSMNQIMQQTDVLKKPLKIKFLGEDGVDEGGVRREWFLLMARELFVTKYGMFLEEKESNLLWFNPDSPQSPRQWEIAGSLVGLAVYNSVLLDVAFPRVVYRMLLGQEPSLADLAQFRPDMARGLQSLLDYDGDDVEDVFCLDFSAVYESWGERKTHDLLPNGSTIEVTSSNKQEYVDLFVKWVLVDQIRAQFEAFKKGFMHVASSDVLLLIRAEELERLAVGSESLDFASLREAASYEDGFDADSEQVQWLWEAVDSFSPDDKKRFLQFATGTHRAPIRGLGSLNFVLSCAGADSDRLPSAHTCFNHMLVPRYATKEKLVAKLKAAIAESEGFGLM